MRKLGIAPGLAAVAVAVALAGAGGPLRAGEDRVVPSFQKLQKDRLRSLGQSLRKAGNLPPLPKKQDRTTATPPLAAGAAGAIKEDSPPAPRTDRPPAAANAGDARPWIGLKIQEVTSEIAQSQGMAEPKGAFVSHVIAGGPADRAGVTLGDIIVAFAGEDIPSVNHLPRIAAAQKPGATVSIGLVRAGSAHTVSLTIGRFVAKRDQIDTQGMLLTEISDALRAKLNLDAEDRGAVVTQIVSGTPAALSGLRPGDLIVSIEGRDIAHPLDVSVGLTRMAAEGAKTATLAVLRRGLPKFLVLDLSE